MGQDVAHDNFNPPSGDTRSVMSGTAENVVQARDVYGGVHFHAAPRERATTPRQLPTSTRAFTDRTVELSRFVDLVESGFAQERPGAVTICVIEGMAGIGKTAFAVRAAHLVARHFPDGQLFIDLHGFTPGARPVTADEALIRVLRSLGFPPQQIPEDLDARAALYRDALADTRTLIVLDNAASASQVRLLLPGSAGCLVLVTSRRRLKSLDDAFTTPLDLLPEHDAIALFHGIAGSDRISAQAPELREISSLCGRLPLAVRIAAALLRNRPAWGAEHLLGLLRDQSERLSQFNDGDRDLTGVFRVSYDSLTEAQQTLFRCLGSAPGPDIEPYAAANLLDTSVRVAEDLLGSLLDHNLVTQPAAGRYQLHSLVRIHAQDLADRDPADERNQRLHRLLDYYQCTAARADAFLTRYTRSTVAVVSTTGLVTPTFADRRQALGWLQNERANLLSAIELANRQLRADRVVAITAGLASLLRIDGPWPQAAELHTAAAAAARRIGDVDGEAGALTDLGAVRRLTGDYPEAAEALEQACARYREVGDELGEANAQHVLGYVRRLVADHAGAIEAQQDALRVYRELGDRFGEANALHSLASVLRLTGDLAGGAEAFAQALALYRALGDQLGEANAAHGLGILMRQAGNHAGAIEAQEDALRVYRELGDRFGEANALHSLGYVQRLTGDYPGATATLERALEIHRRFGYQLGVANCLQALGVVYRLCGDYPRALENLEQALALHRRSAHQYEGHVLKDIAVVLGSTGDYAGALENLQLALVIHQRHGNRSGEAEVLTYGAALRLQAGDPGAAADDYERALALARTVGSKLEEARALEGMARCLLAANAMAAASATLRQAWDLYRHIGAVEAVSLAAEFPELDGTDPATTPST